MSVESYQKLFERHKNVCAICDNPETAREPVNGGIKKLCVDHCHITGLVRGLLCGRCNTAIGLLRNDPTVTRQAANYLEKYA